MQTIVGEGASGGAVLEGRAVCVTVEERGEVKHTAARTRTAPPRPTHPPIPVEPASTAVSTTAVTFRKRKEAPTPAPQRRVKPKTAGGSSFPCVAAGNRQGEGGYCANCSMFVEDIGCVAWDELF